jgi:serine/threonine protein kinase
VAHFQNREPGVVVINGDDSNQKRFHVGSTIAGRYRVERPIGEGAMGAVALARHVSLDETVAIKFLRPELRRDPVANARLAREAKALARIKSDHVARVLDVGATLSVGPYMVMEYLEGTDLGEVLENEGPLPVARAVECVLQVCEALTVAHTAGIVHRDIKPQNLFLARHGQFETLKILDFGIAEDAPAGAVPLSAVAPVDRSAGAARVLAPQGLSPVYGTPSYMAPERVRNDPGADHRSDIWSVGVVLHELVTGRAVFDAPSITETCARIVASAPIELELDEAVLPPSLRSIIARCLERDPARRYQSVEEVTLALAPLGTMHERFRGRSTGAFSRRLLAEELAQQPRKSQSLGAAANAPLPSWEQVGAALRARVGASRPLAWLRERSIPTYGAVAAASTLVAAIGMSFGGIHWMSPPPVTSVPVRAEPSARAPHAVTKSLLPRRAPSSPGLASDATASDSVPPPEGGASRDSKTVPLDAPAAKASRGSEERGDERRVSAGKNRRLSAPASEVQNAPRPGAPAEPTAKAEGERAPSGHSRERLVQERVVTRRAGKPSGNASQAGPSEANAARSAEPPPPAKARPSPAPSKKAAGTQVRPVPAWLQRFQSKIP